MGYPFVQTQNLGIDTNPFLRLGKTVYALGKQTSIPQSRARRPTFLHSCAHRFGLHRFESTIAIRVILSVMVDYQPNGRLVARTERWERMFTVRSGSQLGFFVASPKFVTTPWMSRVDVSDITSSALLVRCLKRRPRRRQPTRRTLARNQALERMLTTQRYADSSWLALISVRCVCDRGEGDSRPQPRSTFDISSVR